MDTVSLYNKLTGDRRLKADEKTLFLDVKYLAGLSSQLNAKQTTEIVFSYFPSGQLSVVEIQPFNAPPPDERTRLAGKADSLPFKGMAVNLEIWTEAVSGGQFELRMTIAAHGASVDDVWTVAQGFPFYRNSLLGDIRFALSRDPKSPLLTLSSHESPEQKILSGLSCKGLLEADSIQGANPRLFLGDEAKSKYVPVFGTIAAFPPEDQNWEVVLPYISLYGVLPQSSEGRKLGGLFPLENIQYSLKASPRYSTASHEWESSCALAWMAELVIARPSPSTGKGHSVPIMAEVYHQDGAIRFWSNLSEGLALAWDVLAGFIPGTSLRIPTTEFQLTDLVKLTELELLVDRDENGLSLEWIRLGVETNEEKNRWVLIDGLLTLNAIDFGILVRRPATNPSVNFTLSGLFGIGQEGVLRLTSDFDYSSGGTDYGFSGQLIAGTKINLTEILTHFLGHSQHPALPEPAMEVRDFSFSVRPKSKIYEGEIFLHGDWKVPGLNAFSLHDVFFRLHHASEGETSFQAIGLFDLGGAQLSVAADYVSGGQGWTFTGGTHEQGKISIREWLKDIRELLGLPPTIELPAPIQGLELSDLGVRFNTATKDFSFHGTAEFPLDGKTGTSSSAKLTIQADRTQNDDRSSHALKFTGSLHLLEREFQVGYGSHGATSLLVATYDSPKGDSIDVKKFVSQISTDIGRVIPEGVTVSLKHAQLAFGKTGSAPSKFLFGIELGAGIELSQLPLVGSAFDRSQTLSVVFLFLAASANFEVDEVKEINRLTASGVTKLAENKIDTSQRKVQIKAVLRLGESCQQIDLPVKTDVEGTTTPPPNIVSAAAKKDVKWFDIQKAFGPFHFHRVGIGLSGPNIDFLLDASLQTAGLNITLEGLTAECALADLSKKEFKPTFHLEGLGIDFARGDLKIGGALLRTGEGQYDGALTLNYKKLGIQAFGSYSTVDGHPSLFIYALVNYPIGGPPFFYVEGLALGFGYNRTMKLPTIDQVGQFPLIKHAMATAAAPKSPMEVVAELGQHIPSAVGEYFVTAGVRFTSFKNINGFVLLTALFGQHFEIDLLGKATLSSPPNQAKPLVSASLALLARFAPDEGELRVMAKLLPDAYVFSPDCHLTGGFAFYCWFGEKNKGDFALTLGGYGKYFEPPAHYPRVPPLALNWQINANLKVTAEAYFALTPYALMAGGNLAIVWQSGNLKAWFTAGVDFLIGWQPFHYRGDIRVSIGASYSFKFFGWRTVSVELTADLKVWGPPFSGIVHVNWYIISFDIAFGEPEKTAKPIEEWKEFQKAFLPDDNGICTISAQAGKVAPHGSNPENDKPNANQPKHLGIINPRQLSFVVNSAVPVTKVSGELLEKTATSPALGVAPMNKKQNQWGCGYEIKIFKIEKGKPDENVSSKFRVEVMKQSVPEALWSEEMDPKKRNPEKRSKGLIDEVVCGYEIHLANPISGDCLEQQCTLTLKEPLPKEPLRVTPMGGSRLDFNVGQTAVRDTIKNSVQQPETRRQRQEALSDLLAEFEIDWSGVTVESWRAMPMLVTVA